MSSFQINGTPKSVANYHSNYQVDNLNNSFEMNVEILLVRHGTVCAVVV